MPVNITYFVHSTTTDNEASISSGWSDAKLSEKGITQAKELGELTKDKEFDAVFCSDLTRTQHTAELAWNGKYPVFTDDRLRECHYGDYDGEPSDMVEPLQEKFISKPFPNGESYEMVAERIDSFMTDLHENYNGKNVAIVAHKAPQLATEYLLNGKSWEQAFAEDWRKTKAWQPGWKYKLYSKILVTDDNDNLIGSEYMRRAIANNQIRRSSRVYVFNESGQVLIQQRSERILKPLQLDHSAAGHVDAGETYEDCAYRELKEELDIDNITLELVTESFRTTGFYSNIYKVTVPNDTKIVFDPEEIKEVFWHDPVEIDRMMEEDPEAFTLTIRQTWAELRDKLIT